jgi:hypothetical protein
LEALIVSGVEITDGPSGEVVSITWTLTFEGGGMADLDGFRGRVPLTERIRRAFERFRFAFFVTLRFLVVMFVSPFQSPQDTVRNWVKFHCKKWAGAI